MTLVLIYVYMIPVIFGGLVGSFLNVVIHRWPLEQSIVHPRSACPKCNTPIAWYDNIPVLSWLILQGKCRICKNPISARYPAVELLTAVMSLLTFIRVAPADMAQLQRVDFLEWAVYFYFVAGLIAITFIDFEHYLIPDMISLPAIPLGILGVFVLEQQGGGLIDLRSAVLGAVAGGGGLWLLRFTYWVIRRQEGMGMGDIKMMAMIGAFLGLHPTLLFVVFVSSLLGSVIGIGTMMLRRKDMQYALPFGPFLAIGALLYLYLGNSLVGLLGPISTYGTLPR